MVLMLLLALAATPAASQKMDAGSTGLDPARLEMIRSQLQDLVNDRKIPGAVYLVARHGRVAVFDAVGMADVETGSPMTRASIFQIMSMTKPFTGVAALMLVEEGRLDLRRPVQDYLPEFKDKPIEEAMPDGSTSRRPVQRPPCVWQLMDHTSGIPGDPAGEMADNNQTLRFRLAEAVRLHARLPLAFEPGTRWSYSNMGIATLGRIIEMVSGEDYEQFVRTRILEPLGMKDTFFFPPPDRTDRIALVYKHENGRLVRAGGEILAGDPAKYRAGAVYPAPEFGLYSTAGDLFRFYQMLLNGGKYEGRRYLSRRSIETMTRVFTPPVKPSGWLGGTGYGLTFEVVNQPEGTLLLHGMGTFGHGGAFGTEGWIDPSSDMIRIMLVQMADGSGDPARATVMQIPEAAITDGDAGR